MVHEIKTDPLPFSCSQKLPFQSPLWYAVKGSDVQVVKLLLVYGTDVNAAKGGAATPLYRACQDTGNGNRLWEERYREIQKELLKRGAVAEDEARTWSAD